MTAATRGLKAVHEYGIRDIINYSAIEWTVSEDFFF